MIAEKRARKRLAVTKLTLTKQAARQLRQHGLSRGDLDVILRFGRKHHRGGVTFYRLGRRQIPVGCEQELERLVGVTVLVADGQIINIKRSDIRHQSSDQGLVFQV
jgi:hypothetical protein